MKRSYLLLALPILLGCLNACKSNAISPQAKVTVVGKWFLIQHNLKLIKDGVQVGETIKTDYTKDDFAQYFEDGTGYQSLKGVTVLISLTTFHYTINGNIITMFMSGSKGVAETITKLTETEFAIHYESQIPDPNDPNQWATEVDDFAFKR